MIWDRIFKQVKRIKFGYAPGGFWAEPPARNLKGYLNAYGEVYSLFGIAHRIAEAVSGVKWRLYKGSDRSERSQIADHPILKLLDFANEFQTGQEIMELTQLYQDLSGRAFWYLPKNGLGVPGEVWALSPDRVKIVPSPNRFIAGYKYQYGSEEIPLGTDEVIWFPLPDPTNPYGGVGYVQASAVEIDSEMYAGQWNRNFFYNSARPDAVLQYEDKLTDEEFNRLKEQWQQKHGGLTRSHKTAILEGGVKYVQTQMSQKDMDFSELRKQTRENLMFAFGMPLPVMGITENVNRANAEAGHYVFALYLIKPRLIRRRNKLNEQLVPMFPKAQGVELDFDEVVPETIEQKRLLAESGIKAGYMSINEGRQMQGLDPIPDGDQLLIPMNLIPMPITSISPAPPKGKSLFPTEEHKETYWKVWATRTLGFERAFISKLRDMFNGQEKEALKNLNENTHPDDKLFDLDKARDDYKSRAKPILSELIRDSMSAGNDLLNPEPAHRSKQADTYAMDWLDSRIGWAAEEVGEETAKLLTTQLQEGLGKGEGVPQMARRVKGVFNNCTRRRALTIARTETIMASNEGALAGYSESGVVKEAEFFAAPDACDEYCAPLDGSVYKIDDAHGMIPLHPSCRCTWLPIVE